MTTVPATDEILVLRSQLGDRVALTELIERWRTPIWTFLYHQTQSHQSADDLAQETWLAVLRNLGGLQRPDRFRSWLFTIARRSATDQLRRRYRRPTSALPTDDQTASVEAEDPADLAIDRRFVSELITHLHERDRAAVFLYYLQDCTLGETAQILDIPPGTVKSRLARARAQLADETTLRLRQKGNR